VDNSSGMFHTDKEISGTVVDEMFFDNGFTLLLPLTMEARVPKEDPDNYVVGTTQAFSGDDATNIYQFDKIYIPNTFLRRCWKHPSGKWGFSTIGAHINHVIQRCHQYKVTENADDKIAVVHAVMSYFKEICRMMGTKRGDIASYGMSVRYPHSARGTATLKIDLPDNTIEIHRDMANVLGVTHGDVVIAERFPCLGFMSIRPQYVHITDDDECRYTIRVSGNSLVSMDLDFDGDTIFLASFKTPEAIEALTNEMVNPNKICETEIRKLNNKKVPCTMEMSIEDYEIVTFPPMGVAEHSNVVRKSTGVKSHTGPVIALAYNLMRIVERHVPFTNVKQHAALEIMLHFRQQMLYVWLT